MELGRVVLALFVSMVCMMNITLAHNKYYSKSRQFIQHKKQVTKLHFYFHETTHGKNPSAVLVAGPDKNTTNETSTTQFGSVLVIDDPLTVGPELNSDLMGNAQGMYVFSGHDKLMLVIYADFAFTKGKFNGSSFSVFSRNSVLDRQRELGVVGGRGKFRMAQGFAKVKTYIGAHRNNGGTIVEYKVTLIH